MTGSRRLLLVILGLVLVILLALGGFYLYLSGGQDTGGDTAAEDDSGLIHVRTIYTYGDDEPILRPVGAAVDEGGDIYVTLRDDSRVVKFNSDGDYITHWGERGAQPGMMLSPMNLAADSLADHVYVADRARLRLIAYTTDGEYLWETPLLSPLAPAVDPDGRARHRHLRPPGLDERRGRAARAAWHARPRTGTVRLPAQRGHR